MLDAIGKASHQDSFISGGFNSRVEILKRGQSSNSDVGEHTRNRTKLVDGNIIIETYTVDGKLVKITPPGYLPLDKIA